MKAIMIMFDSLNRRMLEPYGCDWTFTPNFSRLAEHTVTFDNCFAGSLPCMPARRELHTGRYNFLHCAWGPLEPFDDSMPEILKQHGVYTHLITDHYHYWEDGGATYHSRYHSWESVRGQEGDPWKAAVGGTEQPENRIGRDIFYTPYYYANRNYIEKNELKPSCEQIFDLGIEFLDKNADRDEWFLQIEGFDPHEPFCAPQEYQELYPHAYSGPEFDWPDYRKVTESQDEVEHIRMLYAASLSMADVQLGRILDYMDAKQMWNDTMLIVCTDHGFLLGEHGWWAKNQAPNYNEIAHIPLFVWDPRSGVRREKRKSLVQMIDMAPTLLDYFQVEIPKDIRGKTLKQVILNDEPIRDLALFGIHSAHVCCTDGEYVYMRAPVSEENQPVYIYSLTWMATSRFLAEKELDTMELINPLSFTKGMKILRMKISERPKIMRMGMESYEQGNMLFHQVNDILQMSPLEDKEIEGRMIAKLICALEENCAPEEQYIRLGLV